MSATANNRSSAFAQDCDVCGRCCWQEVPITVFDVHRLAAALGRPAADVFELAVGPRARLRRNAFSIRRDAAGRCVFHDPKTRECRVHAFKPRVCRFFPCGKLIVRDPARFRRQFLAATPPELFWEHKLAEEATAEYLSRHGSAWDAGSFAELVEATERRLAAVLRDLADADRG